MCSPKASDGTMDPFTALGLAANIAQFVDMGMAIIRNARHIKDAGATANTLYLTSLTSDIKSASASLMQKSPVSPLDTTISSEEKVRESFRCCR